MNWVVIILITLVVLLLSLFLFYQLYWLNQPQVFLVYNPNKQLQQSDDNKTLISKLETATGAQLATYNDLKNDLVSGLNVCINGIMADSSSNYIVGWPTYVDTDVKSESCSSSCTSGCIAGCGCNKMVNIYGWDTAVRGVWLKGSKPTGLSDDWKGWQISPFSAKRNNLGVDIQNKYEILGIPKLF